MDKPAEPHHRMTAADIGKSARNLFTFGSHEKPSAATEIAESDSVDSPVVAKKLNAETHHRMTAADISHSAKNLFAFASSHGHETPTAVAVTDVVEVAEVDPVTGRIFETPELRAKGLRVLRKLMAGAYVAA
jgi:hypothetical protein